MLDLQAITAGYGSAQVLFDLSLQVKEGQLVSLMGRNGMGKTTTVKTIMGQLRQMQGQLRFEAQDLKDLRPDQRARLGLGYVPEGRHIFSNLTLRENLVATARPQENGWNLDEVLTLFPQLAARTRNYGNQLSGGEQQMLAIARALMTNPKLLILDEATEGLAPVVRQEIFAALKRVKARGQAALVIDKNLAALLDLADQHYILEKGRCVWQGTSSALTQQPDLIERYLGLAK